MASVIGKTMKDFDREQLVDAVKGAVVANRMPIGDAENCVQRVIEQVEHWLSDKTEVTSHELRLQAAAALSDYDADAADYYLVEKKLF
ncbi:hypothetical protein FWC31_01145 [Candidatus Saccharibacteria bacterium]|nr:hypothetical protein [Candidatus Saccharibacteria bacterium]